MPRSRVIGRPLHPCPICRQTWYYEGNGNCVNCVMDQKRRKNSITQKSKYAKMTIVERVPETVDYSPKRRFSMDQFKSDKFKLAERVIMAGVNYGEASS